MQECLTQDEALPQVGLPDPGGSSAAEAMVWHCLVRAVNCLPYGGLRRRACRKPQRPPTDALTTPTATPTATPTVASTCKDAAFGDLDDGLPGRVGWIAIGPGDAMKAFYWDLSFEKLKVSIGSIFNWCQFSAQMVDPRQGGSSSAGGSPDLVAVEGVCSSL